MNLRLTELPAKAEWLERLSALLRDAQIVSQGTWDIRSRCFEVSIIRIAYEAYTVVRGSEKAWEYPSVETRLTISPVISFVNDRDTADCPSGNWEQLQALELEDNVLRFVTDCGLTKLTLGEEACLEARDMAALSSTHTTRDHRHPAVDLREARQILHAKVL